MSPPSSYEHGYLRGLLAVALLCASAAKAVGQPPQFSGAYASGTPTGAPPMAAMANTQLTRPGLTAAQPPVYAQSAPTAQPNGAPSYPSQPLLTAQAPGNGPFAPPPQMGGVPFSPPPNGPPAYPYSPVPPGPPYPRGIFPPPMPPGQFGPYAGLPAQPPPNKPVLPDMVYLVAPKFWFRADTLVWWTKGEPAPQPIVTVGSTSDAVPGALGQPGTNVVYGANNYNFGYIGGVRIETGVWLDQQHRFGVEAGYFVLIKQNRAFSDQSDAFGNPVIARPTIDVQTGAEGAYLDSLMGQATGGVQVITHSEFQGANCDGALNLVQTPSFRLDGLLGFRYLNLTESLNIYDQYGDVAGGPRSFNGAPLAFSDTLSDFDGFRVTNSFYGGSAGARLYYAQERWFMSVLGKVAWGPVQERATISGSTILTDTNGNQTMLPGGILATRANMGSHYQSVYAIAPEGQLNISYQLRPSVVVRIGYTFLYLSNVARPGNQITRVTSANLVPSSPTYGAAGPTQTAFQFRSSSYWAQGLNFGLDLRY
jgi:hypothetical protein